MPMDLTGVARKWSAMVCYNLRDRPHNRQLPDHTSHLTNCNFWFECCFVIDCIHFIRRLYFIGVCLELRSDICSVKETFYFILFHHQCTAVWMVWLCVCAGVEFRVDRVNTSRVWLHTVPSCLLQTAVHEPSHVALQRTILVYDNNRLTTAIS